MLCHVYRILYLLSIICLYSVDIVLYGFPCSCVYKSACLTLPSFTAYFPAPRPRTLMRKVHRAITLNLPQELRKQPNETFDVAGGNFDPIKMRTGIGDRSGGLRLPDGSAFLRFFNSYIVFDCIVDL